MGKLKTTILVFLLSVLIIPAFQGCFKDPVAELTLSAEEASVENYNGTTRIEVISNGNWTATFSDTWGDISPRSGSGNGAITLVAHNNMLSESRSAFLTVACNGLVQKVSVNQDFPRLQVDTPEVFFDKVSGSRTIGITSNTNWSIELPINAVWLAANRLSGTGNQDLILTVQENSSGPARSAIINILYGADKLSVKVTQRRSSNNPPSTPLMLFPANGDVNISTIPEFRWSASQDPDGDNITYTLYYSKDNVSWTEVNTTKTELYIKAHLSEFTSYTWKVKATDSEGGSSESQPFIFNTGLKKGYADGEFKIHRQATAGLGGAAAEILLIGDGYTAAHFIEGGAFEADILEGIGYILDVEPVKTYKNHLTIFKQAAYSEESGATEADKSITKNTALGTSFNGGSAISVSEQKVLSYARMITGDDEERLRRMLIIVVINHDRYAGTTYIWTDGFGIALIPVSRSAEANYRFGNVLVHEAIGHGLGGLADEYVTQEGKVLPASNRSEAEIWMEHGFFRNIDFTSDPIFIKWKRYLSEPGYDRVGVFEGAYYYSYGVWRSEVSSCMVDNQFYFNAPSREAIVRRILAKSGHTFNMDDFITNDTQKSPPASSQASTKSSREFIPLAPPVLMTK